MRLLVISLLGLAVITGDARADETLWTNAASDGDWANPANWSLGLPDFDTDAVIQKFSAMTWPWISAGTGDCAQLKLAYDENMRGELTVTAGAVLNVYGDLRISRRTPGGQTGSLYISGADTQVIGHEDIEVGRYGEAAIDMNGGYLCTGTGGEVSMAYRNGSSGTIYLRGGIIEIGTGGIRVGNSDTDVGTALIDISGGTLILAGDAVAEIDDYVDEGVIVGCGGAGVIASTLDAGRTFVRAYVGVNMPPKVDAGDDQTILWPDADTVHLDATVTDDDPCGMGEPTLLWTMVSGPNNAVVVFHPSDTIEDPCATFSAPGTYELLLRARDSGTLDQPPLEASDRVTITVAEEYVGMTKKSFIVTRLNNHEAIVNEAMFQAVGATHVNAAGMREGQNINGPSVLRIPDWIAPENRADPSAVYYLYFASHRGDYIRMAWSENIEGPWRLYNVGTGIALDRRGVLSLTNADTLDIGNDITIYNHLASPDIFADADNQRIVMYFHGPTSHDGSSVGQSSFAAACDYGLDFNGRIEPVILGGSYFHVFEYGGDLYALDNGADIYRALDIADPWSAPVGFDFSDDLWAVSPNNPFESDLGEISFPGRIRHTAVYLTGDTLMVFYSRTGDTPERIQMSTIDLSVGDYDLWDSSFPPEEILQAEPGWEGGQFPPDASSGGHSPENVNQLRDPYVFEDTDGILYLFYAGCGEDAIGLARLDPVARGDFDINGYVQAADLAVLADQWLRTTEALAADLDGSGTVDFVDFAIFTMSWENQQ